MVIIFDWLSWVFVMLVSGLAARKCSSLYDEPRSKSQLPPVFGGVLSLHHPPEIVMFFAGGAFFKEFYELLNIPTIEYLPVPIVVLLVIANEWRKRNEIERKKGLFHEPTRNYAIVFLLLNVSFNVALWYY